MKAKCPHCFGEKPDCEHCEGGFVEVSFPEGGRWFTEHCTNPKCGFNNGGCHETALEGKQTRMARGEPCIMCRHPETVMIPMEEAVGDEPWRECQKDKPFAQRLLAYEERINASAD